MCTCNPFFISSQYGRDRIFNQLLERHGVVRGSPPLTDTSAANQAVARVKSVS